MRAVRWDGEHLSVAYDLPDITPGPGDALVRVHLAGICRTDIEITRGYGGFRGTPGHEWVGHVLAADDASLIGNRVVGEINFACGRCQACATDLRRHCPNRRVMGIVDADGAFADVMLVPSANLLPIPALLSDQTAVFTEPVAAAYEVLEQLSDVTGQRAVVLGDGKLGLLVGQVLQAAGADVFLAGHHPEKLQRARMLGLATGDPAPGADLVVDATGTAGGLGAALRLVRPRGTVVLKTTIAAPHHLDLSPAVINEVTIVGSRCGRFAPALAALADGTISVAPLVDAVYPLADAPAALERAATPGVFKVLLDMQS